MSFVKNNKLPSTDPKVAKSRDIVGKSLRKQACHSFDLDSSKINGKHSSYKYGRLGINKNEALVLTLHYKKHISKAPCSITPVTLPTSLYYYSQACRPSTRSLVTRVCRAICSLSLCEAISHLISPTRVHVKKHVSYNHNFMNVIILAENYTKS